MAAWVSYVQGHAALVRQLNAEMLEEHGMGINDYEVLLRLWFAPDHQMRRIDLAESVLLTASGITRLLDRLQAAGYVDKAFCPTDARVTYAVLTDAGIEKFNEARTTHLDGVQRAFGEPLHRGRSRDPRRASGTHPAPGGRRRRSSRVRLNPAETR